MKCILFLFVITLSVSVSAQVDTSKITALGLVRDPKLISPIQFQTPIHYRHTRTNCQGQFITDPSFKEVTVEKVGTNQYIVVWKREVCNGTCKELKIYQRAYTDKKS